LEMDTGRYGEHLARKFLEKKGFKFIEKNFKTPRWGEVDLIMKDGDTIVFVEVKTRSESSAEVFGGPLGAINAHKLQSLKRAGQFYLANKGSQNDPARIDAVSVVILDSGEAEIEYLPSILVVGLA